MIFLHDFFSIISFATIAKAICKQIFASKIDPGHKCGNDKTGLKFLVNYRR